MECLQQGNKCDQCVVIAETAFRAAFLKRRPDTDEQFLTLKMENIPIRAPIEEQGNLSSLRCDERRARAKKIGQHMGETYAG